MLAPIIYPLGYTDLDASDLLSRDRRLTANVSRWIYEQGFHGIVYASRLDPALSCWAIFDRAEIIKENVAPLSRDDPDLRAAARLLGLTV
jgi:hypothetical protein